MSNTALLFNAAELSSAAYSQLGVGPAAEQLQRLIDRSGTEMSPKQAEEYARRYPAVVAFYDDLKARGLSPTGFQVAVFKDTAGATTSGNLTLAFRGTENSGGDIVPTDADIAFAGAGFDQIVAMANWWRRVATPVRTSVVQYAVAEVHVGELTAQDVILRPQGDSVLVLRDAAAAEATGELFDALSADPDGKVDVTGHSLGGHLAMAFSTLFPQHTGQVTVFNAPGFRDNATIRAFFAKLGGSIPDSAGIINVIADEALVGEAPFTAIAGLHSKPGQVVNVAIENQWQSDEGAPFSALNHSITAIVDSLAVYKLLFDISRQPGISESDYKTILNQAAPGAAASLEQVIDALERLLGIDNRPLESGNGKREELYQAIQRLNSRLDESLRASSDIRPSPMDAGTMNAAASGGQPGAIAYRYALEALSPIVVLENDGLYSVHNGEGQLGLYDLTQRTGSLTSSWLEDRSAFLERKIYRNRFNLDKNYQDPRTADLNAFPNAPDARGVAYQLEARHYEDLASGYVVSTGGPPDPLQHILFGGRAADVLRGAGRDDRLYGGSGSDVLAGRYGADYLEGGSGLDVYEYGATSGFFTSGNDGNDIIRDTDGKGVLRYTYTASASGPFTKVMGGAVLAAQGGWRSADGAFNYSLQGADMIVTVTDGSGGTITLRDFRDGDFGIRLQAPRNVAQDFVREFLGDLEDWDSKPESGIQPKDDGFGNALRADGQGGRNEAIAPDRADTFFGKVAADAEVFDTGGGDDVVYADGASSRTDEIGGGDLVQTGGGRDIVEAGGGSDWIEGGTDPDILGGNAGDDTIYADSSQGYTYTLEQAIQAGDSAEAIGGAGELMTGDGGDDLIIAGNASDLLFGGVDEDVIVGGAGDDTIYGDFSLRYAAFEWSIERVVIPSAGVTLYKVDSDTMAAQGTVDAGGSDVLYGGAGRDWIFADAGDDYADGGPGDDVVLGEGGNDIVLGGAGNDVLSGDSAASDAAGLAGDDFVDGGDGRDKLHGMGGDDILYGGDGDDEIAGGAGSDILYGGRGEDVLQGGPGKDTYIFNRGDGVEVISDTAAGASDPEASIVVLGEGIARGDVKFSKGSFLIDLGPSDPDDPLAGSDQIHFMNFNGDFPEFTAAIGELRFADGTAMRYADVLAQGFDIDGTALDDAAGDALIGTSVTDRIRGYAGSDELEGRDGDDTLTGDAGADRMDAGNGDDVLDGGLGSDLLAGGMGSDDYLFARGDGFDTVVEGALTVRGLPDAGSVDRIVFAEGVAREDVTLLRTAEDNLVVHYGENDEIVVEGQYSVAGADIERIVFANGEAIDKADLDALAVGELDGTTADDELYGTAGEDVLRGHEGDDFLDGGARGVSAAPTGDDVLDGGAGADTYLVYWGMGRDTILDTVDGSFNAVQLSKGATFDSVTTLREGDDLVVRLRGSDDGARLVGFFSGDAAHSWRIAMSAEETLPLLSFYEAQASAGDDYATEAMADYGQQVLGEWRSRSQESFDVPTHAYVRSSWSQTVSLWTRYVPALPEPIVDTVTFVNDPVTHSTVSAYGKQRGSAMITMPVSGDVVTRRLVSPVVAAVESDDEFIQSGYASPAQRVRTTYSFYAGGGGPFANERTVSSATGSVTNVITMSSSEGWAPLTLREDDAGDFRLVYDQVTETPTLQQIAAGPGANTIMGALLSDGDTVALIDGGAGNDYVEAGAYDFAFGGEGDDEIAGGAYALGGAGFDYLHGAAFISGGADDDFLSGAEGETVFHFRPDEPGRDWVEDPNGISLEEFALRAGFSQSPSNLFYGGKFRLAGDAAFDYQGALAARYGTKTSSMVWETLDIGESTYRYAILPLAPQGYPRGVPDMFDRERAPAYSDGYYSWVFNSVEDVMRDFADLDLHFDAAAVQQIPGVPDLSEFTADNYEALRPYYDAGVIEIDTVELADFNAGDSLVVGYAPPDPFAERAALRLVWGEDKAIDVELPLHDDAIGRGVEAIVLGSESVYIGDLIAQAYEQGIVGTPFEDDIVLEAGGDAAVDGLAADDFISAWDSSAILRGGSGNDEIDAGGIGHDYVDAGAGDDYLYAEDAALLIGGPGNDTIESYGEGAVIAFNAGDGHDMVYAASAYTLSLGDNVVASALDFVLDGGELVLTVGDGDSVRLGGQYGNDTAAWPQITLQLVSRGGVTTHDFNAMAADFYANPAFSMADALQAHRIAASDARVIGGELAYRYGLLGTADSLSTAQVRAVLADEAFGLAAQAVQPIVDPVVRGTAGNDVLTGTARADTLIGGAGNDLLDGGLGDDRYVFNAGDGIDRIVDTGGVDTLTFGPGIARNAIRLGLGSLLIRVGDGDEIHLDDFDPAHALESGTLEWFEFDDGTRSSYAELLAAGFDLGGTAGNDVIDGTSMTDRIDGGAGDDLLRGGAGDDAYVLARGGGRDTIVDDAGTDVLLVGSGIEAGDLLVVRGEDDLSVSIRGADDGISTPATADGGIALEAVRFADGTIWTAEQLLDRVNDAPMLAAAPDDAVTLEDEPLQLPISAATFTDPDAWGTLSYTASLVDGSALPDWLAFDAHALIFSGVPGNSDVGSQALRVVATDQDGLSASATFTLTVENVNDAPELVSPLSDRLATEDEPMTFALPANAFADVDAGDALTYGAAAADGGALPAWLSFDAQAGAFSGTPGNDDVGTHALRVTATDSAGASASDEFSLTVENVNDAPEVTAALPDRLAYQNAPFDFALAADLFTDVDAGDVLTLAARSDDGSPLPAWLTFDAINRVFRGAPDETQTGVYGIAVTATDSAGATATAAFDLTVSDAGAYDTVYRGTKRADIVTTSVGNDVIETGKGDDVVSSMAGRDVVFGGKGDDRLALGYGNDIGFGGEGRDRVDGGPGHDLLVGGDGDDRLDGGAGNDVLLGGAGKDELRAGDGNNLLVGGPGGDTLYGGGGYDVFAFNRRDGKATIVGGVASMATNRDTLSFGAGISARDIVFRRSGKDLVVKVDDAREEREDGDVSVTLKNWYAAEDHGSVTRLQFIGERTDVYDFTALVARFDAATRGKSTPWRAAAAMPAALLASSADEAIGGVLAQTYGRTGSVASVAVASLESTLADAAFARDPQSAVNGAGNTLAAYFAHDAREEDDGWTWPDLPQGEHGSYQRDEHDGPHHYRNERQRDHGHPGLVKSLDLQAILEAMQSFAPDRDDRSAAPRPLKLSGASQAASEGVSNWALTRALWQFHLSASRDAALGSDDGGAYGRGAAFPVVSIPAAQAAIGVPGFGRDAQSLQRFGGLQEGLARLG